MLSDGTPLVGPRSCGGTISLDSSIQTFTLNSPFYYNSSSPGYADCYWYVTSPGGREVELSWLDISTLDEYLRLYDHPTHRYNWVSYIRGDIDVKISPLVSSHGGLVLLLDDSSYDTTGRGFLVKFTMSGKDLSHGDSQVLISMPKVYFWKKKPGLGFNVNFM